MRIWRTGSGLLVCTLADCATAETLAAGDVVVEATGPDSVHIGRNLGVEPVVQIALVDKPVGVPDSHSAPSPGCDFD